MANGPILSEIDKIVSTCTGHRDGAQGWYRKHKTKRNEHALNAATDGLTQINDLRDFYIESIRKGNPDDLGAYQQAQKSLKHFAYWDNQWNNKWGRSHDNAYAGDIHRDHHRMWENLVRVCRKVKDARAMPSRKVKSKNPIKFDGFEWKFVAGGGGGWSLSTLNSSTISSSTTNTSSRKVSQQTVLEMNWEIGGDWLGGKAGGSVSATQASEQLTSQARTMAESVTQAETKTRKIDANKALWVLVMRGILPKELGSATIVIPSEFYIQTDSSSYEEPAPIPPSKCWKYFNMHDPARR